MTLANPSDDTLRDLLHRTRTIAVVGYSTNAAKAGAYVPAYLAQHGYDVTGINPAAADAPLPTVPAIADLPATPDLLVFFRRPEQLDDHLPEILALSPLPPTVWLQLGIRNDPFAQALLDRGVTVVQDRCLKIEHARLTPDAP